MGPQPRFHRREDARRRTVIKSSSWSSRPYETPADLRLMQALTSACWRSDWPAPSAHPGDLDWWSRDSVSGAVPLSQRVQLWFEGAADASDLVAWSWFNLPGDVDLLIRPDARSPDLVGAIARWAEERTQLGLGLASPPEAIQLFTPDAGSDVISALLSLGFSSIEGAATVIFTRQFGSWSAPRADLPPGFAIRALSSDDVASRVACGRLAFPHSQMTPERYDVARRSTLYRPGLDQIAVAPDGSVAGFALGWLDPVSLALELEPVGVHPAWQRRGLGRALCLATIRAAIGLGATHGLILADSRNDASRGLYSSLGYEISSRIRAYRRALPA
jgi:mycothiol synthase